MSKPTNAAALSAGSCSGRCATAAAMRVYEFSRQRFTKRKPRRVEPCLDRLGNRRIGEAAVAQRPRRECHDRR